MPVMDIVLSFDDVGVQLSDENIPESSPSLPS